MDLAAVVSFLQQPDLTYEEDLRDSVKLPWEITPYEYVQFAQLDIDGTDKRSTINALSNAKRGLECQIDSLMLAFGMGTLAERWSVPKKLEVLQELGVIAPRILTKINRHRNEMEHEYTCPKHDVVGDFVDVVALFVHATNIHINDRLLEISFEDENRAVLEVSLYGGKISVTPHGSLKGKAPLQVSTANEADFRTLLGAIIKAVGLR